MTGPEKGLKYYICTPISRKQKKWDFNFYET